METLEQGTREGRTMGLFTEVGWIPVNSIYAPTQHIGEGFSSVGFRERIFPPWASSAEARGTMESWQER